jgi:predicted small lipoprotein YifL
MDLEVIMKRNIFVWIILAAMTLSLAACGAAPAAGNTAPAAETQDQTPAADDGQIIVEETPETETEAELERLDGERFEAVIILEGMEETVQYEHIRREDLGFRMNYDYENFLRQREADRERFVSDWDDPEKPENYLEVTCDPGDPEQVADAVSASLSQEYDLLWEERKLDSGLSCTYIEASVIKGTNQMADQIDVRYIVPAADGCRIVKAHYWTADSEGYARRIAYLIFTLSAFDRSGGEGLTDDQAIAAIAKYCAALNPDLEEIVNAGEYPAYWEIESSDAQQVVVLFRSYTGALVRYYIDRTTGDTRVTEFVPGITPEEMPSDESLNAWDYV